ASADQLLALDARIVLHPAHLNESDLPRTAIRPYPAHYTRHCLLKNGAQVRLRPIRPEDELMMIQFHLTLMDNSVYLRSCHMIHLDARIAQERLTRQCFIAYGRGMALVAEFTDPVRPRQILGVARMKKLHGVNESEIAVIGSDPCHNCGLGTQLVRSLV